MSKKTQKNKKIYYLLYKNTHLVDSLYAQVFKGDLIEQSFEENATNEAGASGGLNFGFVKADISGKLGDSSKSAEKLQPHDYKVVELLDELNLVENPRQITPNSLVKIFGSAKSVNVSKYAPLMFLVRQAKGETKMTLEFFKSLLDMYYPDPVIQMCINDQKFIMPTCEEYIIAGNWVNFFGTDLPGEYYAVGISMPKKPVVESINTSKDEGKQILDYLTIIDNQVKDDTGIDFINDNLLIFAEKKIIKRTK